MKKIIMRETGAELKDGEVYLDEVRQGSILAYNAVKNSEDRFHTGYFIPILNDSQDVYYRSMAGYLEETAEFHISAKLMFPSVIRIIGGFLSNPIREPEAYVFESLGDIYGWLAIKCGHQPKVKDVTDGGHFYNTELADKNVDFAVCKPQVKKLAWDEANESHIEVENLLWGI